MLDWVACRNDGGFVKLILRGYLQSAHCQSNRDISLIAHRILDKIQQPLDSIAIDKKIQRKYWWCCLSGLCLDH